MLVIIGFIVVIVAVLGGFLMEGGVLLVLFQPAEFIIIGGAALGALLVSSPPDLMKKIFSKVLNAFKPAKKKVDKKFYLSLLRLMHDLFQLVRVKGVLGLDEHIESPQNSDIFKRYPEIMSNAKIVDFLTDTLRLMAIGNVSSHSLENVMDVDADTQREEGLKPGMLLQKIGDSMPGLGIVAAVLGIVITMKAIDGPPEEIGEKVGAALVGTFLGILICYGFVQPLATNIDLEHEEECHLYDVIKAGVCAFANDLHPLYALEFARRTIFTSQRPSFIEMEKYLKEPLPGSETAAEGEAVVDGAAVQGAGA
ncbi:MAG: flagellar motor stator protein MotA [Candidatus Xenobiia bacterium LiM19]